MRWETVIFSQDPGWNVSTDIFSQCTYHAGSFAVSQPNGKLNLTSSAFRHSVGLIGKDEWYCLWGFKNKLQQILPPTLSISNVHTSNKYITTNTMSIYFYKVAHYDVTNICKMSAIYSLLGLYLNATLMLSVVEQILMNQDERIWTKMK